jgi:serine/threonine protein kinase
MSLPLAANTVDAAALADELARFRVVAPARLSELLAEFTGSGPAALAEFLIRRGVLTLFQAERALAGESRLLALGPYRLTGLLSRGSFGPLFAAAHVSKPGRFAVRVLPLRSLWKAKQAKQLARALSAAVKHPAVLPLAEVDSANGYHYLVWPDAGGERLFDRVSASGPLAPGVAAALVGHLATAVAACHAAGAVHGAITPHSVAVDPTGLPLLMELGAGALLAQNVADDEWLFDSMSSAAACATVLTFAAPELAAAPQAPTAAADQYALGALGYFAVTGLAPYPHPALAEQLRAKRNEPPPSAAIVNPAVPADLAAVFGRMMAPNPADRFPALAEVEEQLALLATAEPAPPAEPPAESLLLSRLAADAAGGAISWGKTGSSALRPPERDGSEASVTFDLPETPETLPEGAGRDPARRAAPDRTGEAARNRAAVETPCAAPAPTRPEAALTPSPADTPPAPAKPKSSPALDPRLSAPVPVQWHPTEGADDGPPEDPTAGADDGTAPADGADSLLWRKVKRSLRFWQNASDTVQVSVFGPSGVTPGQTVKLMVYLHTPDAAANVRTLSRAFQHDAELMGTGRLSREVGRAAELAVHLSVANAGVAKSLLRLEWRGQPHRLVFELHVPWESPEGASPGLVSVGLNNVRVGRTEFRLHVLARKA